MPPRHRTTLTDEQLLAQGRVIEDARKAKGWSRNELCERMVHRATEQQVFRWEKGRYDVPPHAKAELQELLGVDLGATPALTSYEMREALLDLRSRIDGLLARI